MATSFPSSLDSFTNPSAADALDSVSVPHADQHANLNDAMEAVQAKLGVGAGTIGEWTDYTPNVAASTGTITTGTLQFAQYSQINDFVLVRFGYTVITAGTAAGASLTLDPPSGLTSLSSSGTGLGIGREWAVTGASLVVLQAGSNFRVDLYTGAGWIANNRGAALTFIFKV
jgi:hypothetical protein